MQTQLMLNHVVVYASFICQHSSLSLQKHLFRPPLGEIHQADAALGELIEVH
jgi:hypothetical protein